MTEVSELAATLAEHGVPCRISRDAKTVRFYDRRGLMWVFHERVGCTVSRLTCYDTYGTQAYSIVFGDAR